MGKRAPGWSWLAAQGQGKALVLKNDLCESSLQPALALFERIDSPNNQALALVFASALAVRLKDHQTARHLCEQALDFFTQTGDRWGQSYAWYQLGLLESRAGKTVEAQKAMQSSLEAAYSICDQHCILKIILQLAAFTPIATLARYTVMNLPKERLQRTDKKSICPWCILLFEDEVKERNERIIWRH
jgi:tetratricopeptide (TPR) repeat protein